MDAVTTASRIISHTRKTEGGYRPRVLIFHPSADTRQGWTDAIEGLGQIFSASDLTAVSEIVMRVPIDVLVCQWEDGLFERAQQIRRGIKLVHVGPQIPEGLIDAADQRREVGHASQVQELAKKIFELTRS